jgi:hypothetical protein
MTKYHVYGNGGTGGPIDYSAPIATVAGTTWSSPALAPGSSWAFGVRAFDDATGLEESNVDAALTIALDGSGAELGARPIAPVLLTARATASGGVRVGWCYPLSAARRARRPTGFRVYAGTGGVPDYSTPLATVPYTVSSHFRADLYGLTPGTPYMIGVRAFGAAGEEANTSTALVTPSATGPDPVVGLTSTATSASG